MCGGDDDDRADYFGTKLADDGDDDDDGVSCFVYVSPNWFGVDDDSLVFGHKNPI